MSKPSIGVLISTYNAPDYLRLVLEGYRRQSSKAFSIYIADDGSSDQTRSLIDEMKKDFPVAIEHIWQEDRGFRKARVHNKALLRVKEPYVLLTDGDCIPLPRLVETHQRFAHPDFFISGSRILLSQAWSEELLRKPDMIATQPAVWWLKKRLEGKINRFFPLLMPCRLSSPSRKLEGIRGCHLSCSIQALKRINGFDESFEGWGREDSDLAARLLHAGLKRRNLRGMPVLHLWHPESSRERLGANDAALRACLEEKRIKALKGLDQFHGADHG